MIQEIEIYSTAKEYVRKMLNEHVGQPITFKKGKNEVEGIILEVADKMDQIRVRSSTGKEYPVFWLNIISINVKTDISVEGVSTVIPKPNKSGDTSGMINNRWVEARVLPRNSEYIGHVEGINDSRVVGCTVWGESSNCMSRDSDPEYHFSDEMECINEIPPVVLEEIISQLESL